MGHRQRVWLSSLLLLPLWAAAQAGDSIPLIVTAKGHATYRAEVDVLIDGHRQRMILDSGARLTSVVCDDRTVQYPALRSVETGGAFGHSAPVDMIRPEKLEMGPLVFAGPTLERTTDRRANNLLGIDLLSQKPFQVDLRHARLNLVGSLTGTSGQPLRRLNSTHIAVPLKLGDGNFEALFDTGAEITVIDLSVVQAYPHLFLLTRTEKGIDSTGRKLNTSIYRVDALQVGALQLHQVEMAAFDFGEEFRGKLEGAALILGNNVIYQGRWSFDIPSLRWSVEAASPSR